MLNTEHGNFTIVNANSINPSYFWNGTKLTEVLNSTIHCMDGFFSVKLKVQNTTNFDTIYSEMTSANIQIKKHNG